MQKLLVIDFFIAVIYLIFQAGQLNEYTERKDMSADVVCMALASVPSGEQRSRFLAVGLADNTVRIISLDPNVSSNVFKVSPNSANSSIFSPVGLPDTFEYAGTARRCRISLYRRNGRNRGKGRGARHPRVLVLKHR